jgi:hypothetical protein
VEQVVRWRICSYARGDAVVDDVEAWFVVELDGDALLPQSTAGVFPTTMGMGVVSRLPVELLRPERAYWPGLKSEGTSHVQLPVFGTLSVEEISTSNSSP